MLTQNATVIKGGGGFWVLQLAGGTLFPPFGKIQL